MALLDRLSGLLDSPGLNLGIGLLAAGGPRPVGQGSGTGDRLADALQFTTQRRAQSMELEAARESMLQRKRQQEAQERLRSFAANLPEGMLAPEQQQFLGLLSDVDPASGAQITAGLLGFGPQQGAARGLEGTFQAIEGRIGRNLTEEEAFQLANRSNGQGALEAMQAQLGLMTQRFELEKAIADRDEAAVKKARDNIAKQNALDTGLARALEIAQLNDSLEGTALEPGMAADIRGAAFSGLSLVDPKQRELVANFQRFSQLTGQQSIRGIVDMLHGAGTISDTKFKALKDLSFGPSAGPSTNRKAVADLLDALMDSAETNGLSVRERERIDQMRRELREGKKVLRLENGVTVEFLNEGQ